MRKLLYVYKTQAIFNCGDRFTADQIGPCILPYCIIIDNTIDSRVRSMDPTIGPTETAAVHSTICTVSSLSGLAVKTV